MLCFWKSWATMTQTFQNDRFGEHEEIGEIPALTFSFVVGWSTFVDEALLKCLVFGFGLHTQDKIVGKTFQAVGNEPQASSGVLLEQMENVATWGLGSIVTMIERQTWGESEPKYHKPLLFVVAWKAKSWRGRVKTCGTRHGEKIFQVSFWQGLKRDYKRADLLQTCLFFASFSGPFPLTK